MKHIIRGYSIAILFFYFLGINCVVFAQDPPPPPGGAGGITNTNPNRNGGGAPIGEGIFIFSLLAAGYGGIKTWKNRKITPKGV